MMIIKEVHVSPLGSDENDGSKDRPLKSLEGAKAFVRNHIPDMQEDITVYLHQGTYFLKEPLLYVEADGGKNGCSIRYKAYMGQRALISGGKRVSGFKLCDNGLWKVNAEEFEYITRLVVNGKKAYRAASKKRVSCLGYYRNHDEIMGVYADGNEVGELKNSQEIQLKWSRGWKIYICNVNEMQRLDDGRVLFVLDNEMFRAAVKTGNHRIDGDSPFFIENAAEYLDTPGDFYFDRESKILYYKPRSGETIDEAEVIVPNLESILQIKGEGNNQRVRNLSFEGLTFSHAIWNKISRYGYASLQAQVIEPYDNSSRETVGNRFVPANLSVEWAENIQFIENTFQHLGSTALAFYNGVNQSTVKGNVFCDIGGGALTVGLTCHNYEQQTGKGRNVALFKPVSTSSIYGKTHPAINANNDVLLHSHWRGNGYAWWQVDLGEQSQIDEIQIVPVRAKVGPESRKDFRILVSNHVDFQNSKIYYEHSAQAEPFAADQPFCIENNGKEKFRYVRLERTSAQDIFMNEIRVIDYSMPEVLYKSVCKDIDISDNCITNIGDVMWDAPAIQGYYTNNMDIHHNTMYDLPYSAIGVGWGWHDYTDSDTCRNNKIRNNYAEDYTKICFDGAGVYLLGNQPNSYVKGNYFKNQHNFPGTIYPDQGTAYYTIEGNVTENVQTAYFLHQPSVHDVNVWHNYSTTPDYRSTGTNCSLEPPVLFIPGLYEGEVAQIIANAGVTEEYKHILKKASVNERPMKPLEMFHNIIHQKTYVSTECFMRDYCRVHFLFIENVLEQLSERGGYSVNGIDKLQKALEHGREIADQEEKRALTLRDQAQNNVSYENREMLMKENLKLSDMLGDLLKTGTGGM